MTRQARVTGIVMTIGLLCGGVVVASGTATAAAPTCGTAVAGVLPDGRLIDRRLTNTSVDKEYVSTDPLPFPVDNLVFLGADRTADGSVGHYNTFASRSSPRNIDVTRHDSTTALTVDVAATYSKSFDPRLVAGSGRYYVYGLDQHGNLARWTREVSSDGDDIWFSNVKIVARHMGGLKTLSYSWTYKINGGWKDVLYATTKKGALKQIKVPWKRPANAKITTLKKRGFASYTGLSLSFCNDNTKYLSIVAIDNVHNRARLYTLPRALRASGAALVRRGWVAPGADWRLHATL